MSGPSRLPLEALKHASKAIGSAVSPSLVKPAPSPVSSSFGANSSQPFLSTNASSARTDTGTSASPKAESKQKEKEKEEQQQKKKKAKIPKWRGAGKLGDLMHLPVLMSPVRIPRNPIVLCHGLYGFDVRGPFLGLEIHYWAAVMDILKKKLGAEVVIRGVPGTGSIQSRAEALHQFLCSEEAGVRGRDLNIVGHSMGGLDARHLISNIRPSPEQYRPVSLTTICTPHRGSPFMDWCNANIGIGNDAIEEALREVKAGNKSGESRSVETDDYKPPPYSLKSPLFVRPSKRPMPSSKDADEKATTKEEQAATTEKILSRAGRSISDSLTFSKSEGDEPSPSSKKVTQADKGEKSKESDSKTSAIFDSIGSAFSNLTGQLSDYMLSLLDTPAYAMLSTKYMNKVFNPSTPDDPQVKYYSIAARTRSIPIWHPLWLPKLILDAAAESRTSGGEADGSGDALGGRMQGNDGLVSVQSAQWGEFLGIVDGCDHWDLRGGGGPRMAEGKVKQEVKATVKKAKSSAEEAKGWIDVDQLLGLWRAIRPSGSDKSTADTESRSGPDAMPNAQHMSTVSAAQQEHLHQQNQEQEQEKVNRPPSLESQQPGAAIARHPKVEQSKNVDPVPVATAASQLHDSDAQTDSVSDIVQTFMHAYSHLADPQHDESDYDWTAAPSFTPTSDQESIITEIAQWISERLPQRDEGRRAEAEKEAAAQDQELAANEHEHAQALSALSASQAATSAPPSPAVDPAPAKKTVSLESILPRQLMSGASLASSLESANSAPLSQYRIRHKDEDEDEDPAEKGKEAGLVKDIEELELFWLAVCHHLWARGF